MKTKILLTSLVAIGVACAANAETDVTFGGDYTLTDGTPANVATPVADATYTYEKSDGSQTLPVAYDVDPTLTDFTYLDKDGHDANLSTGTPTQSDFAQPSTASGVVSTTQPVITSGIDVVRSNYSYTSGDGSTVELGDAALDMEQTVNMNATYAAGHSIDVTNGTAAGTISGAWYTDPDTEQSYHLSDDGTTVMVSATNLPATTPIPGSQLETAFGEMLAAYTADSAAITDAETVTAANYATELTNFGLADTVFTNDSNTKTTLDGYYQTLVDATNLLADAQSNQTTATQTQTVNMVTQTEAVTLYNSSITDTITDGAEAAIDDSIAGGAIKTALDAKADAADVATNTTNIATNTAAIAENAANVATNADAITAETNRATTAENALDTRVTANADAITAETNRATAAENALRGDFAKADAATLKSAKAYTDQRVSDLEDDMSAGIASTAALSSVAVSGVKRGELSFGGGYGYYNNQSAFALGATMGLTDNWSINAGAGLGMNGDNVAIRAGTNYKIKLY